MKKTIILITTLFFLSSSICFSEKKSTQTMMPQIKIETLGTSNPKYKNKMDFATKPFSNTVKLNSIGKDEENFYKNCPSPWTEASKITVIDESGKTVINGDSAKVKVRGNYTTCSEKKPFNISFDSNHSLLGLHEGKKYKNWILLASWKDFSILRDLTGFYLSKLIDEKYYASDCKLVEVYINNQYWGVYLLAEPQSAERIGLTSSETTETGYLFEYDYYASAIDRYLHGPKKPYINDEEDNYFKIDDCFGFTDINGGSPESFQNFYAIKNKVNDKQKKFLSDYMNNLWYICKEAIENHKYYKFNSDFTQVVKDSSAKNPEECLSKIIDLDSLVNTYIISELACDPDLNYSSFYMDVDFGKKGNKLLTFEAPWDFDSALGHKDPSWEDGNYTRNYIKGLFAADVNGINKGNPWTIIFIKEPWFQKRVTAKWDEIKSNKVKDELLQKIDEISNNSINVQAFARNYKKWGNMNPHDLAYELSKEALACKTQKEAAGVLKNWLIFRFEDLDKAFAQFGKSSRNSDVSKKNEISDFAYVEQSDFMAWTNGNQHQISDNVELGVKATKKGLNIIKVHNPEFKRIKINVFDETTQTKLFYIDDVDSCGKNPMDIVNYPFVEKDHIYKVTMELTKEDWTCWHSIETSVRAVGGKGNLYFVHDGYSYNQKTGEIKFKNLKKDLSAINDSNDIRKAYLFGDRVWGNDNYFDAFWNFTGDSTIKFYKNVMQKGSYPVCDFFKNKKNRFAFVCIDYYVGDVKYSYVLIDGQL